MPGSIRYREDDGGDSSIDELSACRIAELRACPIYAFLSHLCFVPSMLSELRACPIYAFSVPVPSMLSWILDQAGMTTGERYPRHMSSFFCLLPPAPMYAEARRESPVCWEEPDVYHRS